MVRDAWWPVWWKIQGCVGSSGKSTVMVWGGRNEWCVCHVLAPPHRVFSQLRTPSYFHSEFSEVLGYFLWEHVICVSIKRVKTIVPCIFFACLGLECLGIMFGTVLGKWTREDWCMFAGLYYLGILWKALTLRDTEDGVECLPYYFGV